MLLVIKAFIKIFGSHNIPYSMRLMLNTAQIIGLGLKRKSVLFGHLSAISRFLFILVCGGGQSEFLGNLLVRVRMRYLKVQQYGTGGSAVLSKSNTSR